MAQIDTTKIEGYAEMTVEQKLNALENFTYDDGTEEITKLKNSVTNANGEASRYKKELKALQDKNLEGTTESERQIAEMQEELANLRKANTISEYKSEFLSQGYDNDLALETAKAMVEGDMSKVFENNKKFLEEYGKKVKKESFKSPTPPKEGGKGTAKDTMTLQKFRQLSPKQRYEWQKANPEDYKNLYKK